MVVKEADLMTAQEQLDKNTGSYVAVVGGLNVDIGGKPFASLIPGDSNPGKVTMSLGGVGRNIAHDLSLLGMDTKLFTVLGDDLFAQTVEDSCASAGIDISHALRVSGTATSTYLYLCGEEGDMVMAVSDMSICEKISPAYLSGHSSVLDSARLVVADANIPEDSLVWLAKHCTAPVFVDPVSVRKSEKLRTILGRIHTLKPNRLEASFLSGVEITDEKSLISAVKVLLGTGMQRVFISLGSDGVLAADHSLMIRVPCYPAEVKSTTGAGDAFMAALALAFTEDLGLEETALFASAAASLAVESSETVNQDMSLETVRSRMSGKRPEIVRLSD